MSITILSAICGVIVTILQILKIDIAPDKIQTTVEVIVQLAAFIIIWIRRKQVGDVSLFGKRK